jgi:gliding motility-associated-like protein
MIAMSSAGCLDSLHMTNPIHVKPSELDVPNVFSPDGDGTNDYFKVTAKSLKEFKITIFNRWGNLVYEHVQTEDKFEWEGWDGTIHGKGNNKAAPGVYYFVIEAIGWDKEKYRGGIYRGFVYLFRSNE